MIVAVRRALAGLALGAGLLVGVSGQVPAQAETPTPTPAPSLTATATPATPGATSEVTSAGGDDPVDTPDIAPDNSNNTIALAGAGALALVAAAVVFLRRS
jgi:hypothetical protein